MQEDFSASFQDVFGCFPWNSDNLSWEVSVEKEVFQEMVEKLKAENVIPSWSTLANCGLCVTPVWFEIFEWLEGFRCFQWWSWEIFCESKARQCESMRIDGCSFPACCLGGRQRPRPKRTIRAFFDMIKSYSYRQPEHHCPANIAHRWFWSEKMVWRLPPLVVQEEIPCDTKSSKETRKQCPRALGSLPGAVSVFRRCPLAHYSGSCLWITARTRHVMACVCTIIYLLYIISMYIYIESMSECVWICGYFPILHLSANWANWRIISWQLFGRRWPALEKRLWERWGEVSKHQTDCDKLHIGTTFSVVTKNVFQGKHAKSSSSETTFSLESFDQLIQLRPQGRMLVANWVCLQQQHQWLTCQGPNQTCHRIRTKQQGKTTNRPNRPNRPTRKTKQETNKIKAFQKFNYEKTWTTQSSLKRGLGVFRFLNSRKWSKNVRGLWGCDGFSTKNVPEIWRKSSLD